MGTLLWDERGLCNIFLLSILSEDILPSDHDSGDSVPLKSLLLGWAISKTRTVLKLSTVKSLFRGDLQISDGNFLFFYLGGEPRIYIKREWLKFPFAAINLFYCKNWTNIFITTKSIQVLFKNTAPFCKHRKQGPEGPIDNSQRSSPPSGPIKVVSRVDGASVW